TPPSRHCTLSLHDALPIFPINVMVDMLGLPKSDHDRFHKWYQSIMAHLNNLAGDPEITARAQQTRQELRDYMMPIIAERRTGDGGDLLTRLGQAEGDGRRMSDEEAKALVSPLLGAGGGAADKATANSVRNRSDHPDQMGAV